MRAIDHASPKVSAFIRPALPISRPANGAARGKSIPFRNFLAIQYINQMKKFKTIQSDSKRFKAAPMRGSRRSTILIFAAIGMSWCATSRTASAGAIDINGGSSWGGWELRGNSRDVGIWAKDSTTRDYDLYTTVFVSTTTQ